MKVQRLSILLAVTKLRNSHKTDIIDRSTKLRQVFIYIDTHKHESNQIERSFQLLLPCCHE